MASIEEELEPYHDENNNNVYDIIEIHYVWISHGESVSASNQKYAPPIPREFDNKLYAYAPYDTYLFPTHEMIKSLFDQSKGINYNGPELRNQIILNDFRNSLKSADIKPLNKNREKQILRPLHFASGNANDELSKYIGLYRLVSYSKKYLLSEQIMDVNGMIKKHENKGGATILYDDIFRYIKKDIQELSKKYSKKSNLSNVKIIELINSKIKTISLFSCSYIDNKYRFTGVNKNNKYGTCAQQNALKLNIVPYLLEPNKISIKNNISVFYLHYNPQELPEAWSALAGRTDRGCGINLLDYFGILLPETNIRIYKNNVGRCLVTCLPITGQTTWNFVRHLMNYGIKKGGIIPRFSIARFEAIYGLYLAIYNLIRIVKDTNESTVVFVKLLKDETFKKNGVEKISIPGHFIGISVRIDSNGSSFVIYDPQNANSGPGYVTHSFSGDLSTETFVMLAINIYQHYGQQFNYVDLILTDSLGALIWEGVTNFPIGSDYVSDKNLKINYGFYYENIDELHRGYIQYSPDGSGSELLNNIPKNAYLPKNQRALTENQIIEQRKEEIIKLYSDFLEKNFLSQDNMQEDLKILFNRFGLPYDREILQTLYEQIDRINVRTNKSNEIRRAILNTGALSAENRFEPMNEGGSKNKRNKKTKRNKKANKKTKRNKKAKKNIKIF